MINFLKTKNQIYKNGFSDGYDSHKLLSDKKIKKLKSRLKRQNKKIKELEKVFTIMVEKFQDARDYAIQLDKINKINFFELAKEFQENKLIASTILQYCRSFEKHIPETQTKINECKIN